jgi:hypothetical protein
MKKNIEALIDASKEISLEINRKLKYMLMCHHRNAGQNHNVKIANRSHRITGFSDFVHRPDSK